MGWPCYTKFMVVPNYTYLKLKMPGPNGVITIESTYEHAYDCDIECIEYAKALVEAETLITDLDQLGSQLPEPKRRAGTFEPTEAVKLVPVKDGNGSGLGRISAGFGFCGFGFGDGFSPTVFGFGAPKPIGFGFEFGFPPVDIHWISEINHLELKLMFYNILIIICLLRLLNLFKVDS